jgi:hypothetical protein
MTVPFLQSRSIKLKVATRFPALIEGRTGITVAKVNGNYFVDIDYTKFTPLTSVPTPDIPNLYTLVWNIVTGSYELVPLAVLGQIGASGNTIIANASYLVQQNDGVIICKFSAPGTISLPLAGNHNGPVHISDGNLNASVNNITITPAGGETIAGLAQWTLAGDGAGITLYPVSGTGWFL